MINKLYYLIHQYSAIHQGHWLFKELNKREFKLFAFHVHLKKSTFGNILGRAANHVLFISLRGVQIFVFHEYVCILTNLFCGQNLKSLKCVQFNWLNIAHSIFKVSVCSAFKKISHEIARSLKCTYMQLLILCCESFADYSNLCSTVLKNWS